HCTTNGRSTQLQVVLAFPLAYCYINSLQDEERCGEIWSDEEAGHLARKWRTKCSRHGHQGI
ncbi:unnamed protein product, partial [Aphanomyces euteiches]